MPRNPIGGLLLGAFGLAAGASGLALGAWAATSFIDPAQAYRLAEAALVRLPPELAWPPSSLALLAQARVVEVAIVAVAAIALAAWSLRAARIAFRPAGQSRDGKAQLQLQGTEHRVGRPFEGTIRLAGNSTPGEEFRLRLTCVSRNDGGGTLYQAEQRARARPGAQGVSVPFRFEVPASAPTGALDKWRLDVEPVDKGFFGRSTFDVALAAAPAGEVRAAHAAGLANAGVPAGAHGAAEQIERIFGLFGGKLTAQQKEALRGRLAGESAAGAARQRLEALAAIPPGALRLVKFAFVAAIVVFFVLPLAWTVLGLLIAAFG